MSKELEEAIQALKSDIKKPLACGDIVIVCIEDLETALNYIDNSIPKEVVEKKLQDLERQYKIVLEENSTKAFILKCQIEIVQELLEGK